MGQLKSRMLRALAFCIVCTTVIGSASAVDVIVDNTDSGFTILSGGSGGSTGWQTSSTTPGFIGTNYRFKTTTIGAGSTPGEVELRPTLPSSDQYEVAVYYNTGTNRSTAAPYTVDYNGGSQTINVNQQINGNQWFVIGTFNFFAGATGRVRLNNQTTGTVVMADAVRFRSSVATPQLIMAVSPAGTGATSPTGTSNRTLNEVVNIAATPNAGYNFSQWTVSAGSAVTGPASANTTVTMDQSKTVTANFVPSGPAAPEFRCMWVTRFEWPDSNQAACKATIDQIMTKLQAANFNAVMFQMRGQCDVLYPSPYEPWSPLIVPGMADPGASIGWDPMAYAIKSAHDHGLEFHAYINTHTCWGMSSGCGYSEPPNQNHVFHQHCKASDPAKRDWLLHDNSQLDANDNLPNKRVGTPVQCAESNYVWMAPAVPDMQAWVRKQIMYVVEHYDGSDPVNRPAIQAVHWDRIRTPSSSSTSLQYSHDPISVARFNGGEANPDNLDFYAWTREAVNRFTRDIYAQINEARPDVIVSSSPLGMYSPERYIAYGYPQSACGFQYEYTCIHQDGQNWMANGSMDILNPQIYWADLAWRSTTPHYSEVAPDWIGHRADRFMCPGHIGAVGSHPVESIVSEIKATRAMGGQGDVVFSYSMWDNPSFNGWAGFTDPVNGVYQQPAPMPAMPWKTSPSVGIIIGNVTGTDGVAPVVDAQITRTGSSYVALSSGDGLYAMLLVPPGTYTVNCSKSVLGARQVTGVNVTAGQVTRVNISYVDGCPNDPNKIAPGVCGCGIPDTDSDGDGVLDCNDGCPNDINKIAPGVCGCNVPESGCTRTITQWRTVRTHPDQGDLAIVLNATATGNGSTGPTVETRTGGIQKIQVDFSNAATLTNPNGITIVGYTTTGGVLGGPQSYTPTSVSMLDADTLQMTFSPGVMADETCYTITIAANTIAQGVSGDNNCNVRCLLGDTNMSGEITNSDVLLVKSRFNAGASAVDNPHCDVNLSGTINNSDVLLVKSRFTVAGHQAFCP